MNQQVISTIKEAKQVTEREAADIRQYMNELSDFVFEADYMIYDRFFLNKRDGQETHRIIVLPSAILPTFIIDDSPVLEWLEAEAYIMNLL